MKKRLGSILVLAVVVIVVVFVRGNKSPVPAETKRSSQESSQLSPVKEEKQVESRTLSFSEVDSEGIHQAFGYLTTAEIIEFLHQYKDEERIVLLDDHTVLKGSAIIEGVKTTVEVDSETDPNGMTVADIKGLLVSRQDELDKALEEYLAER
ncbi:hypothetical protein ACYSNR_17170 [Enterococcus sp. LJL128]